jgi:hypothetical protein
MTRNLELEAEIIAKQDILDTYVFLAEDVLYVDQRLNRVEMDRFDRVYIDSYSIN